MKNSLAIVSTFYDTVGGVSTYVKQVYQITKSGGNPTVLLSADLDRSEFAHKRISVKSRCRLLVALKTAYQLGRHKIQFVQCHGVWYLLLGCLIYRYATRFVGCKVRVITVKHSDIDLDRTSLKKRVYESLDNLSDGIVFVCEHLRRKYSREFGFRFCRPTYVVRPGCVRPVYNKGEISRICHCITDWENKTILTYIGLFEYEGKLKGLFLLLECLQTLRLKYENMFLAIAGRGSKQDEVFNKIRRLGLSHCTRIFDDVNNGFDLLKISYLHCHISFQDCIPITILEALSAGVPVVASSVGDVPNLKIIGLTVVPNEKAEIVRTIERSITNRPTVDVDNVRRNYEWRQSVKSLNGISIGGDVQP